MKNQNELVMAPEKIKKISDKKTNAEWLKNMSPQQLTEQKKLTETQAQFVRDSVSNLPTGELAVIYLRFWEGLCEIEISRTLHLPVGAVQKLLLSALERLRRLFIEPTELILAGEDKQCA